MYMYVQYGVHTQMRMYQVKLQQLSLLLQQDTENGVEKEDII